MLVLAITLILMVVFFLYVRQKLIIFENRLELMSETIQTMAGVTRAALQDSDEESEHSDSDSSEESEHELQLDYEEPEQEVYPERVTVSDDDVKKISVPENEILEELEVKKMVELEEVEVKKLTLSSLDEVKNALDSLTLKELKDKVAELNGPKLKTKKELIEFLQNKI
jgi:hypothetical protein